MIDHCRARDRRPTRSPHKAITRSHPSFDPRSLFLHPPSGDSMQNPMNHRAPLSLNSSDTQHRGRANASDERGVTERDRSTDSQGLSGRVNGGDDRKGAKKAGTTSHVICKFFRQGVCASGASCPFSHEMAVPGTVSGEYRTLHMQELIKCLCGQTKPICQWYTTGNCKFGHKVRRRPL